MMTPPDFTIYDADDPDAPTFAGEALRNKKGLCAKAKCGNPIVTTRVAPGALTV